jgi:hypothetical protein
MLDSIATRWPEGTVLTNNFYGIPSICFFMNHEEGEHPTVSCIVGHEGARMGCVMGSFGFNITMEDRVFSHLRKKFPHVNSRALTDDHLPVFAPPNPATTTPTWPDVYQLVKDYWTTFDTLAQPLGIFRNDKSKLLLPPAAPDPDPALRLKPVRDGCIVSGIPIGTAEFTANHAMGKVEDTLAKATTLVTLAADHAQMAVRLLGLSCNKALHYYTSVTPPQHITAAIAHFDLGIARVRNACLTTADRSAPMCGATRQGRADTIASLPFNMGGADHTRLTTISPAAFIATLITTYPDPILRPYRHYLLPHAEAAHGLCLEQLGMDPDANPAQLAACDAATKCIPPHPALLVNDDDFIPNLLTDYPKIKPQALITRAIHEHKLRKLRLQTVLDKDDDPDTTPSDLVNILSGSITSRSQLSRVFRSPLYYEHNRIPNPPFIAWLRAYLTLPQLLTNAATTQHHDTTVNCCRLNHPGPPQTLDASGDHAAGCKSAFGPRYKLHTNLAQAFVKAAHSIGLDADREPPTASLLDNQFSPAECAAMFPKNPNRADRERAKLVSEAISNLPHADGAERKACLQNIQDLLRLVPPATQGRRVDACITNDRGDTLWLDVGATHTSVPSSRTPEAKFLIAEVYQDDLRRSEHRPMTPAVLRRVKVKNEHYTPLLIKAQLQLVARRSRQKIGFLAAIVTHTGQFSNGIFSAIEFLSMAALRRAKAAGHRDDGVTPARFTAGFRTALKDRLATAIVTGYGKMLGAAGLPQSVEDVRFLDQGEVVDY